MAFTFLKKHTGALNNIKLILILFDHAVKVEPYSLLIGAKSVSERCLYMVEGLKKA